MSRIDYVKGNVIQKKIIKKTMDKVSEPLVTTPIVAETPTREVPNVPNSRINARYDNCLRVHNGRIYCGDIVVANVQSFELTRNVDMMGSVSRLRIEVIILPDDSESI